MRDMNILFVDDEENILKSLKRALQGEPYNVFLAKNANEAFKILKEYEIAVVITDLNMPEINGLELLYSVKQNYPDTVRVILSGYTDIRVVLEAIKTGETHRFLTKPWKLEEELLPVINQSIGIYKANKERRMLKTELEESKRGNENLKKELEKLKERLKLFEQENLKLKIQNSG